MNIDKEGLKKIIDYNENQFAEWFRVGFDIYFKESNRYKAFYPLHSYVGMTGDLTKELCDIYDNLKPHSQLYFRKGLVKVFSEIEPTESNIQIVRKIMFLAGLIHLNEMINPIIQQVGNGFFGVEGNRYNIDLFAVALDIVKSLSNCYSGGDAIRKLIGSFYFRSVYAPKAFIALCFSEPEMYPKHLKLLRNNFYEMHCVLSAKRDAYITARRFVNCVNMQVIANKFIDIILSDVPDITLRTDNWFANCLFVGENAPLKIIKKENEYYIGRNEDFEAVWSIGTIDAFLSYEFKGFLDKILNDSICDQEVIDKYKEEYELICGL
jgi:hypothetical protein